MKKILSILLTLAMAVSLLAGCGGQNSSSQGANDSTAPSAANTSNNTPTTSAEETGSRETIKIGVGFRAGIDLEAAKAFFDMLAKQYNVEFVYSEVLKDIEAELAFIDNAASIGCKAIISWAINNVEQAASASAKHEMYYVCHSQWRDNWDGSNPYWVGTCGFANPPKGVMYKEMLDEFLKENEAKGIVVTSGLASSANIQHIETTTATLQAIMDYYGLTFTGGSVSDLAVLSSGTKLDNDKGLNVYLLPGTPTNSEGYTTQLSTLMCSGAYNIVASYDVNTSLINVVNEAEEVTGFNIIVGGIAIINDAMTEIFNSKDRFGTCPVDRCAIQYSSITQGAMFAMVYNAVTGYDDILRNDDGTCTGYGCGQVTVYDPGNGAIYGSLDNASNPDSIVATVEWVDTLIVERTPNFTKDAWIKNFVNVDCNTLAEAAIERIR